MNTIYDLVHPAKLIRTLRIFPLSFNFQIRHIVSMFIDEFKNKDSPLYGLITSIQPDNLSMAWY